MQILGRVEPTASILSSPCGAAAASGLSGDLGEDFGGDLGDDMVCTNTAKAVPGVWSSGCKRGGEE